MPAFRRDFREDYLAFEKAVKEDERFCLVRFHDGEYACIRGSHYKSASGWSIRRGPRGAKLWLQQPLLEALQANIPGYHVGLSPSCCARRSAHFLRTNCGSSRPRVTFSTLFFNSNYERALRFIRGIDGVVVSSGRGDFKIPGDGVNRPWDLDGLVTQLLKAEKPILLAAGPSSCIIGHRYWVRALDKQTKNASFRPQMVLDMGSTLDVVIHDQRTRLHHDRSSPLRKHSCTWGEGVPPHAHEPQRGSTATVPVGRHVPNAPSYPQRIRVGHAPVTGVISPTDPAIAGRANQQAGDHRQRVKDHLREQKGTGAWARRRVRKKP